MQFKGKQNFKQNQNKQNRTEDFIGKDILEGQYHVIEHIGKGTFGDVFKVCSNKTGQLFAAKFEKYRCSKNPNLQIEFDCMQKMDQSKFVPKVHTLKIYDPSNQNGQKKKLTIDDFSQIKIKYWVLIMDLVGQNLEEVFENQMDKMTKQQRIQTCCYIGKLMIQSIKDVHQQGIIHRDIKPNNFCLPQGCTDLMSSEISLIDFGLSKYYSINGEHVKFAENKTFAGTPRYCSLSNHMGFEQSRRDDLESIGHNIIYLLRGCNLPWQGIQAKTLQEKYQKTYEMMASTSLEELCEGLPDEILTMIKYCRQLQFMDEPNYQFLIQLLENIIIQQKQTKTLMASTKSNINQLIDSEQKVGKEQIDKHYKIVDKENKQHKPIKLQKFVVKKIESAKLLITKQISQTQPKQNTKEPKPLNLSAKCLKIKKLIQNLSKTPKMIGSK